MLANAIKKLSPKGQRMAVDVLKRVARDRCVASNCGTVCLCEPCMARAVLNEIEPDWNPR